MPVLRKSARSGCGKAARPVPVLSCLPSRHAIPPATQPSCSSRADRGAESGTRACGSLAHRSRTAIPAPEFKRDTPAAVRCAGSPPGPPRNGRARPRARSIRRWVVPGPLVPHRAPARPPRADRETDSRLPRVGKNPIFFSGKKFPLFPCNEKKIRRHPHPV